MTPTISLAFDDGTPDIVRRRIGYAFELYCCTYGFSPVADDDASVRLTYGGANSDVAATYEPRRFDVAAPLPRWHEHGGRLLPIIHSLDQGRPDFLGEVFEWASLADEGAVRARDDVGRIPFLASFTGRHGLDPETPWGSLLLRALHDQVRAVVPGLPSDPRALNSPLAVAASHDLDFLGGSLSASAKQVTKNLIRAALARRGHLVAQIARSSVASCARGRSPLDQLESVALREQSLGITSTLNVIARNGHRRDGGYHLDGPRFSERLDVARRAGMRVGLHGSYTSLDQPGGLELERKALLHRVGDVAGGRQHWLRFSGDDLYLEAERAGLRYDSSVSWSERPGFRAGLASAYRPYLHSQERAANLIELPLVLMDVSLDGLPPGRWRQSADTVMHWVRRIGVGGASVVWHDSTFGGAQIPQEIADHYWHLGDETVRLVAAEDLLASPEVDQRLSSSTAWNRYG